MTLEEKRCSVYCYLEQTVSYSNQLIKEFKNISFSDTERLKSIEEVYLQIILVNLTKIFTQSANEHYSLNSLSKLANQEICNDVKFLHSEHADLIGRIKNNRDKLIVHTDKKFYELKHSVLEVVRIEAAFKQTFPQLNSTSSQMERISPRDFKKSIPELNQMIVKLNEILEKFMNEMIIKI